VLFIHLFKYYPAKTLCEPDATAVQVGSPIRPQGIPFTKTVDDPALIGSACGGQCFPTGNK
jgi:hypothetical protein